MLQYLTITVMLYQNLIVKWMHLQDPELNEHNMLHHNQDLLVSLVTLGAQLRPLPEGKEDEL